MRSPASPYPTPRSENLPLCEVPPRHLPFLHPFSAPRTETPVFQRPLPPPWLAMHSHRQTGARDGPVTLGWPPLPPSSQCAAASGGSRPLQDKQGSAVSGTEAAGPGRPPAARPCLPAGTEAMAQAGRCPVPERVPAPRPAAASRGRDQ